VVKTLTANAQTAIATKRGEEAIIVIEIDWADTVATGVYADRDFSTAEGRIISISDFEITSQADQIGTIGALEIVLNDSDGVIKAILDDNDVHKRTVNVYQAFGDLALTDKFLLMRGKIETPVVWDEGKRTINLSIATDIEEDEVGFSIEEGEFDWIADSAVGKAWPLCFGSVKRVPALKVATVQRGQVLNRYKAISKADLDQLCSLGETYEAARLNTVTVLANENSTQANITDAITAEITAQTNLNIFIEDLVAVSNNQESNLRDYSDLCVDLYTLAKTISDSNAELAALEDRETTLLAELDTLYVQIVSQEALAPNTDWDILDALYTSQATKQAELTTVQTSIATINTTIETATLSQTSKTTEQTALEAEITKIDVPYLVIDNGLDWPQTPQLVNVRINNMRLQGQFVGNLFTVTDSELTTYKNISLATTPRPNTNPNEFWLSDSSTNLKGMFCLMKGGSSPYYKVVYVNDQDGTNCYFEPIVWDISGPQYPPEYSTRLFSASNAIIAEAAPFVLSRWLTLLDANRTNPNVWDFGSPTGDFEIPEFVTGTNNLPAADWGFEVGDTVYLDTNTQDVYVANLIPSTAIKEVLAYREIDRVKRLVPVPSRYYTVNLSDTLAGQNCTTITFNRPLEDYEEENWDDSVIYVTLTSTEGANTADIIEYLIINYTNLTADAITFAAVNTLLTNYPSHFALLERKNALRIIEEIAWQARCALQITASVIKIKYLPTEPSSDKTITETDIDYGSITMEYTPTEDLVTKFIAVWNRDYAEEDERQLVLRNNIPKYGLIEEKFDFYIYNIKELVEKSATFWLFRYSNTWKILNFKGYLQLTNLEARDAVTLDFDTAYIADVDVTAIINSANYDSASYETAFTVWTPIRAGEMNPYVFAWPADADSDEEYPTATDLYAGGAS
jgi:hypothetical protein